MRLVRLAGAVQRCRVRVRVVVMERVEAEGQQQGEAVPLDSVDPAAADRAVQQPGT
ncbi:MAG: hypothetical protein ACRDOK_06135 [Streptosporangiaceae bacterium]